VEQVAKEKNINGNAFGVEKKGLFKNGQKMGYDNDLSASPIVQFRIVSWISYDYLLMRLSYLDIAVLGSLDRHDI